MKDICLVNLPNIQDGRMHKAITLVFPPLGIAYLASVLLEKGHSVDIIDAFAEELSFADVFSRLENNYKIVGFYCHTQIVDSVRKMASRIKETSVPPVVFVGGVHPTALPEETMQSCDDFDYLLVGEAERTIVEFVDHVFSPADPFDIDGIVFRHEGKIVRTAPRALIENLDEIPMPAWHLLPMHRYRSFFEAGNSQVMTVMTSRGCFAKCNFCASPSMWGGRVRHHSAERVIAEVDILRTKYGVKFFEFFDDNLTDDRKRLSAICQGFRERKIEWCCSSRIDLLSDANIESLKMGNVSHVFVGIETMNDRLLKVIGKNITSAQVKDAVDRCAKRGLTLFGMFMFGLPTETEEEIEETLSYVNGSSLAMISFSHLTIFPGTIFWKQYKQSGYISDDFSTFCWCSGKSCQVTSKSPEEQARLVSKAYLRFYIRPRRILFLCTRAVRLGKSPANTLLMLKIFFSIMMDCIFSMANKVKGR